MISQRIVQMPRPGSKVLDEQVERQRREHPPGPLKLSGYPTDPLPNHILEAAERATRENAIAPSAGTRELHQAIADKLAAENAICIDPQSEVLITHGAMHAVHLILQATIEPGDEVLMFSPTYFFGGLIELVRGKPVYAALKKEDEFRLRVEALEAKCTPRTRVLLLNNPCNPTGHIASAEELRSIAQFAERHNLLIISDESYEKFTYDGVRSISFASLEETRGRTLTIQSFTKTYGMAGLRVGYLSGPQQYVSAAQKVLEWTGLMCNYPAQAAAAAALRGPQEWFELIIQRFQQNRDVMWSAIDAIANVTALKPAGTPFVLVNVSKLTDSPASLSRRLLIEHGIPSVSGEAFEAPHCLRIPFGGKTEAVEEASRRLAAALGGG